MLYSVPIIHSSYDFQNVRESTSSYGRRRSPLSDGQSVNSYVPSLRSRGPESSDIHGGVAKRSRTYGGSSSTIRSSGYNQLATVKAATIAAEEREKQAIRHKIALSKISDILKNADIRNNVEFVFIFYKHCINYIITILLLLC